MIMNDHGSETKDISTQRKTWMRENQNQKEKKTTTPKGDQTVNEHVNKYETSTANLWLAKTTLYNLKAYNVSMKLTAVSCSTPSFSSSMIHPMIPLIC